MDKIPVSREVTLMVPDYLAKFIEEDMAVSLVGFCQKALVDLLKKFKEDIEKLKLEAKNKLVDSNGEVLDAKG